jgi:small subunit ribosomal protein S8
MVNDTIADFLTRIRNAQLREKDSMSLPASKMIVEISRILKEEGFIEGFEVNDGEYNRKELTLYLRYINGTPAIRELQRVSKPGVRKYQGYKEIQKIMNGMGVAIYSTPKGIITGKDAKKEKVGGEYICYIY